MTVWAISASGEEAQRNYKKTLTQPISEERLKDVRRHLSDENGDLYAWGFPVNSKGLTNHENLQEGDICFFLCDLHYEGRGTYQFAARVRRVIPKDYAEEVSMAFWDSAGFLPYLIDRPVPIHIRPDEFGRSLNPQVSYMRTSPQGSMRIANEEKAGPAILAHGSLEEWALDLIDSRSTISLKDGVEKALGFDHDIEVLKPSLKPLLRFQKSPVSVAGGPRGGRRAAPGRAKAIGDMGEEAVFNYLKKTLPQAQAETLRWVADEGEKPGYDIEYRDPDGSIIGVEVKSTVAAEFSSFDITVNELSSAKALGSNYHLYLVGNCLSPKQRVFEIVTDPANKLKDRLQPVVYRFS